MRGSRNFFQGGGGLQARQPENSLDKVVFFCPQLILQFTEGIQGFITEKTILYQGSRGGPTFSRGGGGVQLFPGGGGGVQMLISVETHITCDFHGGETRPPITPSGSAHVFYMLKRTVSLRQFFSVPTTYVFVEK